MPLFRAEFVSRTIKQLSNKIRQNIFLLIGQTATMSCNVREAAFGQCKGKKIDESD